MIYIIGAGAIGQALAVFLKHCGKQITLVRGSVDDQPSALETICVKVSDEVELTVNVPIQTFSQLAHIRGPVIVTAKSYGNDAIASKLALKGTDFPVVLLQNGLNVEQAFIKRGFTQLYRCVLMVTSQFTGHKTIRFKPVAASSIGMIKGVEVQLLTLVEQLENPWLHFIAENNIQPLIWKKAITNCVFNSICPLLETDNGIFHRNAAALEIADRMISECISVAQHSGILLKHEEVKAALLSISRSSDGQLISTLQDIRNGRPTEINTLNQEVVRIACELNMGHLVAETRLLGELTAIKSQL